MTDQTAGHIWQATPRTSEKLDPVRPALTTRRMPLFIGDAVTPMRGETLLGLMLKADLENLNDIE